MTIMCHHPSRDRQVDMNIWFTVEAAYYDVSTLYHLYLYFVTQPPVNRVENFSDPILWPNFVRGLQRKNLLRYRAREAE